MHWLIRTARHVGRLLLALAVFIALCLGWTFALMAMAPWQTAPPGDWPAHRPLVVSEPSGLNRVMLYRDYRQALTAGQPLFPWPAVATGERREPGRFVRWQTVAGRSWQFEVLWDDGDHVLESRYRLDGERPVLVESRGRDPGIALRGIIAAVLTVLVWKLGRFIHKRFRRPPAGTAGEPARQRMNRK